jgi:hypothetical protein
MLLAQHLNPLAEMIKLLPTDAETTRHIKDLKYQVEFDADAIVWPSSLTWLCAQSFYLLATTDIPDDTKLVHFCSAPQSLFLSIHVPVLSQMDSARKIEQVGHQQVLCQISAYDNGTLQLKVCLLSLFDLARFISCDAAFSPGFQILS